MVAPVTVVGEVLVDLSAETRDDGPDGSMVMRGRFGGSPANVAVGLARLGIPVRFAGRISRHGHGPWLRAHLAVNGVGLEASVDADEPATLAEVTLDDLGVASYSFYGPGTADWQWRPGELPPVETLDAAAVHTGSLATALPPGAAVVAAWIAGVARRGDVAVSFDPNVRLPILPDVVAYRGAIGPFLDAAHLVKVSEEDLGALYPHQSTRTTATEWLDRGAALVVVTRGPDGSMALHRDGRVMVRRAPTVEVVDTVGAGDAFTAGLLAGLSAGGRLSPTELATIGDDELAAAIDRAHLVAALTCARAGADPPRAEELDGRVLG